MYNIKISVIVPAFNEEKRISKCLQSLVSQTLKEIEIIVVDDGSTDQTSKIVKNFQKSNHHIKYIFQKNQGQGVARNTGLKNATGEYIGFLDADDWVEENAYELLYQRIVQDKADICFCDVKKIISEKNYFYVEKSLPCQSGVVDIGTYLRDGLNNAYSWNRIYKKLIWNNYYFKQMLYEDLELMFTIQSNVLRISYVDKPLFNYYKHSGSTTTNTTNIKLLDMINAYRNAIFNSNVKYRNEIIYNVAKRLLRYVTNPDLLGFKSEFIELIQELEPYIISNEYIKNDDKVKKIYEFLSINTIGNHIVYSGSISFFEKKLRKFVGKNSIVIDAKSLIQENDINYLEASGTGRKLDYLVLRFLFYNGGIYISEQCDINEPLGSLRCNGEFIAYNQDGSINRCGFFKNSKKASLLMKHELDIIESV